MPNDLREQLQRTLSGSYTLESELGGGGMSRVFVAEDTRLRRKVVIKVLSPELAAGVSAERFEREIQVAASLQQANIVPLHSAGETNGLPYFTMPFVEGESLRARLANGPLPVVEVIGILRDVARALSYAHEHGVVHRDIKPDNVLLSHGTAVVTDFGIAKALSASRTISEDLPLTQFGTSIGTPAYMAPEQAAGDADIDNRADIYAFGCMAFELLAGRPPFHGRAPTRILAAQMGESPPSVSELRPDTPGALADLVMRCLEKLPGQRPQSAGDLVHALNAINSGSELPSMPPELFGGRMSLTRVLAIYVVAVVAVALVARAAITVVGLPSWVFPGALIIMALGMPVILFTAYAHHTARRALTTTPTLTPGGTHHAPQGTMVTIALKASPHVSWRRAILGGLLALGAFALLVGGYMILRMLGIGPEGSLLASGALTQRDQVLIADFAVPNDDRALSGALTQALTNALQQSTAITVVPENVVVAALAESRRPANTVVDLAVARDLGVRRGIKAVVAADAASLPDGGYVVTENLVNSRTGNTLASYQSTATSAAGLLGAIDQATRRLRARIGESLRAIHAEPPLERVTTASLEADVKYSQGVRANDIEQNPVKAVKLLRQAVEIDSQFGIAWRKLAIALMNAEAPLDRSRKAIEKAYQFRDRMSPLERDLALGVYYSIRPHVDVAKARAAYEDALRRDSTSYVAAGQLAILAADARAWDDAVRFARLTKRLEPGDAVGLVLEARGLLAQGRFDEAAVLRDSIAHANGNPTVVDRISANTAISRLRYDSAAQWIRRALSSSHSATPLPLLNLFAGVSLTRGRVSGVVALLDTVRLPFPPQSRADSLQWLMRRAIIYASHNIDSTRTFALLDSVASADFLQPIAPMDRPYLDISTMYSQLDQPQRARELLARYDAEVGDTALRRQDFVARHRALGELALAEARPDSAMIEFRKADRDADGKHTWCGVCLDAELGRAYDMAGEPDSAIAAFERYLGNPEPSRIETDVRLLGPVLKRLGELYENKGDRQRALSAYTRFVNLWKDADPPLQQTVAAVRRRIVQLQRAEGR